MTIKQQGGVFGRNPTFNSVEVSDLTATDEVNINASTSGSSFGALKIRNLTAANNPLAQIGVGGPGYYENSLLIGHNNNLSLWINKDGPINLQQVVSMASGKPIQSQANGFCNLNLYDTYGDTQFGYNGVLRFARQGVEAARFNASGNLAFPSGQGIDFSATSGTGTSELFDDYEEGTWTPTISTTGTALTSVTYDPVTGGKYTKVGNLVHVQGIIRTDAVTVGGATGSVQISGLPFSSASNTGSTVDGSSGLLLQYSASFLGENPTTAVVGSSSTNAILYYRNAADGGSAGLQASDLGTGANANFFYFSGTYVAA